MCWPRGPGLGLGLGLGVFPTQDPRWAPHALPFAMAGGRHPRGMETGLAPPAFPTTPAVCPRPPHTSPALNGALPPLHAASPLRSTRHHPSPPLPTVTSCPHCSQLLPLLLLLLPPGWLCAAAPAPPVLCRAPQPGALLGTPGGAGAQGRVCPGVHALRQELVCKRTCTSIPEAESAARRCHALQRGSGIIAALGFRLCAAVCPWASVAAPRGRMRPCQLRATSMSQPRSAGLAFPPRHHLSPHKLPNRALWQGTRPLPCHSSQRGGPLLPPPAPSTPPAALALPLQQAACHRLASPACVRTPAGSRGGTRSPQPHFGGRAQPRTASACRPLPGRAAGPAPGNSTHHA